MVRFSAFLLSLCLSLFACSSARNHTLTYSYPILGKESADRSATHKIDSVDSLSEKKTSPNETSGFFEATDMPIWLSLLLAILAAVGTYVLAPRITKKIEIDKARSTHVTAAINRVNDDIVKLSQSIRRFIAGLTDHPNLESELRGNCLDSITEAQWRIIDLKIILTSPSDIVKLDELGVLFNELRVEVTKMSKAEHQDLLLTKVAILSEAMKALLSRLYDTAQLRRKSSFIF